MAGIMNEPSAASPSHQEAVTVWIIEDNEDYRLTVQDMINSREGLHCAEAFAQCEEALAALNRSFAPDVFLVDIGLPGMSGIEGVRQIKAIAPHTQVIMLTIHEDNDRIFKAICAGASGYLLKASSRDVILDAIAQVREGGAAMNPKVARRVLNMFSQFNAPRWDYELTEREREVLKELVDGHSKQEIADALCLSPHTIDSHIRHIYEKLHVHSRAEAIAKAYRERLT